MASVQMKIENMRRAGKILAEIFKDFETMIKPGVSTGELNDYAHKKILAAGAKPSFLKYGGFPGSICSSVDDEVVHGVPSRDVILKEGQIVGIDVGARVNGFHADAARTYAVGRISPEKQKLIDVTEQSFFEGIKNIKAGSRVGDIGYAVQKCVQKNGFDVIREYVGHGVGADLHEKPEIPNYGIAGLGELLTNGQTIAVEPMTCMGDFRVKRLNRWTVVTADGKASAHYENTMVITENGVEILTI